MWRRDQDGIRTKNHERNHEGGRKIAEERSRIENHGGEIIQVNSWNRNHEGHGQ